MSYLKLPKTVQDHAIGFQSVNQAVDNNDALQTQFDARHSIGVGGNSPFGFPLRAVGRHDDILIARTAADFTVNTALAVPELVAVLTGGMLAGLVYVRMAVGQWRIFVSTPQLFSAVALSKSTTTADRKATCYATYDPSRGPSVTVSTWVRTGGTWVLEDLPFSLTLWAERAA